jgi:4-hydroxy 2-oxovalerate aldolase
MRNHVKILDCTLRDGGYFTNWDFEIPFVNDVISSLNYSNVDIIEIGYKSPKKKNPRKFEGRFKYCNNSLLDFIPKNIGSAEYACMIDASDYIQDGMPDLNLLDSTISDKNTSPIKWLRVASYYNTLSQCLPILSMLKKKGYATTLNLMGVSLLSDDDMRNAAKTIESSPDIDCFYISDSFGTISPSDITKILQHVKNEYTGKLGIHTHDNNGLAFANTICAIDSGIDYVDSTIMGMGRGAGNLRTEQQLLYMVFKLGQSQKNPYELLDVIERWFIPLHQKYRWGWDFTYMLSAMQDIHPTYCMNLRSANQYTIEQIKSILNEISPKNRHKFTEIALNAAIRAVIEKPGISNISKKELPLFIPHDEQSVLVIATGPSSQRYYPELALFIQKNQPIVIECNPSDSKFLDIAHNYLAVILNEVRMNKALSNTKLSNLKIVTGLTTITDEILSTHEISSIPCLVTDNGIEIKKKGISIPAYDVGMYAIAIAYLHNPDVIFLTGFDGYDDPENAQQRGMEKYLEDNFIRSKLVSITPTKYKVEISPVYTYID